MICILLVVIWVVNLCRRQLHLFTLCDDQLSANISEVGSPIGVMAIDFGSRARFRLNGKILIPPGDRGFRMEVSETFPNCPKYIQRRKIVGIGDDGLGPGIPVRSNSLSLELQDVVSKADTMFVATYYEQTGADISHRGGFPGFIRVLNENELMWPV